MVEIRPTIDPAWLAAEGRRHPLNHAFALWDLERAPDRVRFFTALERDTPVGYMLVWLGLPSTPIVHWVGSHPAMAALAEWLPPRPLVAIVPPDARELVVGARGPAREYMSLQMARPAVPATSAPEPPPGIRLLGRDDVSRLSTWAHRQADPVVGGYPYLDPEVDRMWGAFEGSDLVGAVHAEVRLPRIWVIGGVYVEPAARGQGWGHALVSAAVQAAEATGARVGLYCREDRTEAHRLYERLGFLETDRRIWLDLGAGIAP